jgi:hypothetical protein
MTKINIGTSNKQQISFDLDILLRTRLLIQANSGGGKSYLLRRIAEQAFGKVQVIIIDPEGEFLTLREKYDYVLVGKGGETPADVRSAAMVAHKLLELHASAVCDLYEMKASDRHKWVKTFLEALIDSPKNLWHPVIVIVDEAHTFSPEKGAGESEASEAMIGLATRGRKRGFCAVFATQRLGKLRKDAAAELLNILVGQTFIDIDRKRAAESLGIPSSDTHKFFDEIKVINPGNFWALGRAVSKERILVEVGGVQTTHAEPGSSKHAAEPPPAPDKIKALLPKLSDLPQEAEKKAKTEAELRSEILQLKREISARPVQIQPQIEVKTIEKFVFNNGEIETLESAIIKINSAISNAKIILSESKSSIPVQPMQTVKRQVAAPALRREVMNSTAIDGLTLPQQKILDAISWLESVNLYQPKRTVIAFLANQSPKSSGFKNNLGALRSMGLLNYAGSDAVEFTDAGRASSAKYDAPITSDELCDAILRRLPRPQARILEVLITAGGQPVDRISLAEQAGQSPNSSGYKNNLGALRSIGVLDYHGADAAKALPVLFLE